jgi:hypothetical protein
VLGLIALPILVLFGAGMVTDDEIDASTRLIKRVRYFTARVQPGPRKPQLRFNRAPACLHPRTGHVEVPGVTIHFGLFKTQIKQRKKASPPHNLVSIIHNEEKGSDVNLASHLLLDAFRQDFDEALVTFNDSDLRTPVQIVRKELKLKVRVAIPGTQAEIPHSVIPADAYTRVSDAKLAASQLPPTVTDQYGTITKPATW